MVLYVDVQGTVVGNQDIAQADCLQAVADLSDAGFAVRLVSSLPGGVLGGRPIGDKGDAIAAVQPGDWWVDDDIAILKVVLRQGAIAVPAAQLCAVRNLLTPAASGSR